MLSNLAGGGKVAPQCTKAAAATVSSPLRPRSVMPLHDIALCVLAAVRGLLAKHRLALVVCKEGQRAARAHALAFSRLRRR